MAYSSKAEIIKDFQDISIHVLLAARALQVWETVEILFQEFPQISRKAGNFLYDTVVLASNNSILETAKLFDKRSDTKSLHKVIIECKDFSPALSFVLNRFLEKEGEYKSIISNIISVRSNVIAHINKERVSAEDIESIFDKYFFTRADVKKIVMLCAETCDRVLEALGAERQYCSSRIYTHNIKILDIVALFGAIQSDNEMKIITDLLPCAHCKCTETAEWEDADGTYHIACEECSENVFDTSREKAVAQWNRRP